MNRHRIVVAALLAAVVAHAAAARKPVEVRSATPFVVRQGSTATLVVEGRRLKKEMTAAVLDGAELDDSVRVLSWTRLKKKRAEVEVEVDADAPIGVRGLVVTDGDAETRQLAAFRVGPADRVPWPHEAHDLPDGQRQSLIDELFVINNFSLYQAAENNRMESYFHDGLDVVLDPGTPVYSLVDGVVRDIFVSGGQGQSAIAVEDADRPGFGWAYVHVDAFRHRVGETVAAGERIADVAEFGGLPHIHLNRTFVPGGRPWSALSSQHNMFADDHFSFDDATPPIVSTPFRFFRNESAELLAPGALSGEVDVVASMRDGGHYAHSKAPGFPADVGDRLALSVISCEIRNKRGVVVRQWVVDFTRLVLRWLPAQTSIYAPERVATFFKSHLDIPGAVLNGEFLSHYILTNSAGVNPPGEVSIEDQLESWRTDAVDGTGGRLYPNGVYTVVVTAWDSAGNSTRVKQRVTVAN